MTYDIPQEDLPEFYALPEAVQNHVRFPWRQMLGETCESVYVCEEDRGR